MKKHAIVAPEEEQYRRGISVAERIIEEDRRKEEQARTEMLSQLSLSRRTLSGVYSRRLAILLSGIDSPLYSKRSASYARLVTYLRMVAFHRPKVVVYGYRPYAEWMVPVIGCPYAVNRARVYGYTPSIRAIASTVHGSVVAGSFIICCDLLADASKLLECGIVFANALPLPILPDSSLSAHQVEIHLADIQAKAMADYIAETISDGKVMIIGLGRFAATWSSNCATYMPFTVRSRITSPSYEQPSGVVQRYEAVESQSSYREEIDEDTGAAQRIADFGDSIVPLMSEDKKFCPMLTFALQSAIKELVVNPHNRGARQYPDHLMRKV